MTTIKQLLVITNNGNVITTELGRDFNGIFDYDQICGSLTFNLPYDNVESSGYDYSSMTNFKTLKRYDLVQLYFKEFDKDPGTIKPDDLILIFDGFIDKITLSKNKMDYPYLIECLGMLGLGNERGVTTFNEEIGGTAAFNILLQRAGLQKDSEGNGSDIIPSKNIISNFSADEENVLIKWPGGKLLNTILEGIRDKYGIRAHYQGNGMLHLFEPMFYFSTEENPVDITVWNFNFGENVFNIDYGELDKRYNTVVVHYGIPGYENVAIAIDPTSLAENISSNQDIETNANYSIKHYYRYDINLYDDAVRTAKNLLLELIRTQSLNITVPFNPEYKVTDFFNYNDGEIYKDAYFIIKKYTFNISKNDVTCTLYGISSSLDSIPENFITSSAGLTDIHILDIEKEVTDATGWNVFGV